jgi:hypothetical protein
MNRLDPAREFLTTLRQELLGEVARVDRALDALGDDAPPAAPPAPRPPARKPRRPKEPPAPALPPTPKPRGTFRKAADGTAPKGETLASAHAAVLAAGAEGLSYPELADKLGKSLAHARTLGAYLAKKGMAVLAGGRRDRRVVGVAPAEEDGGEEEDEEEPAPVALPLPVRSAPAPRSSAARPVDLGRRAIAVDAITSRDDNFRCLPLACTLTAGACVQRQAAAGADVKIGEGKAAGSRTREIDAATKVQAFRACKACPLGRQVAAALEAHAA